MHICIPWIVTVYLETCNTGCEVVYKPVRTEMGGEVATTTLPVLVALVGVREGTLRVTLLAQYHPQGEHQESKQHYFPQPSNPRYLRARVGARPLTLMCLALVR